MDFYRVPGSLVYKDGASRLDSSIDFFRFIFATLLLKAMIPPVRTDPVWGRAQSGLAVLDWTGLVWTSPNRIIFINFKVDPKN